MDLLRQLGRARTAAGIAVSHDERMIESFDSVYHMVDGRVDRSWRPSPLTSSATRQKKGAGHAGHDE